MTHFGLGQPSFPLPVIGTPTPTFSFVPFANFTLAPDPNLQVTCTRPFGYPVECDRQPAFTSPARGITGFTLNWSADPNLNVMLPGDQWSASFDMVAVGGPFGAPPLPVDACETLACFADGGGPVNQTFTSATAVLSGGFVPQQLSFPPARVTVDLLTSNEVGPGTTPPASNLPPPTSIPSPLPVASPTAPLPVIGSVAPVTSVALQATAAGVVVAVFTRALFSRMALRQPVPVASGWGQEGSGSRFEIRKASEQPGYWHSE